MLKALIQKQLLEGYYQTFRRNRRGNTTSGKGAVLLGVVLILCMMGSFTAMALFLCRSLCEVGLSWLYNLLMGATAVICGTFGSIFTTTFTLYMAKDNDLLLSMPIPVRYVILSRLLGVYIMGLGYSAMVSLPAVVVRWVLAGVSLPILVGGLVEVLLISAIVLGLSCLLGFVVAKISQRLKNRSFLTVLVALVFVGLYYYIYFNIMDEVQNLVKNAIILGGKIKNSAHFLYRFGQIGEGDWLAMLLWALAIAAGLAVIWLLLRKTFLAISTATPTPKRAAYREKESRQSGVSGALLRKEWIRFSTSANYMLNCGVGLIFLLGLGGYLLIKGRELLGMASLILTSFPGAVPVILCAVSCLMSGMVDVSAPSVALEGNTLWQLQCLPVTPWQVLRAKLVFHLLLVSGPTLFCVAVIAVLAPATLAQKLLLVAVPALFAVFIALLGLFMGLKLPNLNWTNETVPIKQSAAVNFTVLSAMGIAMVMGGLYFWFGHRMGGTAYLSVILMLLLAVDAALVLWLRGPGARRFECL